MKLLMMPSVTQGMAVRRPREVFIRKDVEGSHDAGLLAPTPTISGAAVSVYRWMATSMAVSVR
jgi:hypothetical protein